MRPAVGLCVLIHIIAFLAWLAIYKFLHATLSILLLLEQFLLVEVMIGWRHHIDIKDKSCHASRKYIAI